MSDGNIDKHIQQLAERSVDGVGMCDGGCTDCPNTDCEHYINPQNEDAGEDK